MDLSIRHSVHSGAVQPSVRSSTHIVAKGIVPRELINNKKARQARNSHLKLVCKIIKMFSLGFFRSKRRRVIFVVGWFRFASCITNASRSSSTASHRLSERLWLYPANAAQTDFSLVISRCQDISHTHAALRAWKSFPKKTIKFRLTSFLATAWLTRDSHCWSVARHRYVFNEKCRLSTPLVMACSHNLELSFSP